MQSAVYHSQAIQAWEQRWFAAGNSSLGLMQQAAWQMALHLHHNTYQPFQSAKPLNIAVWCGVGNNAGDGYFVASYLQRLSYDVCIYAVQPPITDDAKLAAVFAEQQGVNIVQHFSATDSNAYTVHIDALFGIGLNRTLSDQWQQIIMQFNACSGLKVALDLPSGLMADTGHIAGQCVQADHTLTVLAYKMGLFTGQGKQWSGQVHLLSLIPADADLQPLAQLCPRHIQLPKRLAHGHKGNYGHVLVIGGHADMGGAVIMSAQAAFAAGAGKVTVVCAAKHHGAILARSPNVMVKDIDKFGAAARQQLLTQVNSVCFGMGLGRDVLAAAQFQQWFPDLLTAQHPTVLDADALWFLAKPEAMQATASSPSLAPLLTSSARLSANIIATPHSGEAATLLGCSVSDVENDRVAAIQQLSKCYGGQWVLKGAGSLVLQDDQLFVCSAGNAGMGTAGMGDVLAGMIASLKAQFTDRMSLIPLAHIVQFHALAGDFLAANGERGIQACDMPEAIYVVVNNC